MTMTATGVAPADGADLYYERRGSGPALLLIVGGGGDCSYYSGLGDLLASRYTVLSYDRRGNSRSLLHSPATAINIAEQSTDALAVLAEAGFDSALIFGNSGGATIALDLAAHHPRAAEFVVAHEPPVPRVLPDAAEYLAIYDDIAYALATDGWIAAFTMFQTRIGRLDPLIVEALLHPESRMPPGPQRDEMVRFSRNWEYLTKYEIDSFIHYEPDLAAIRANGSRVTLGYGAQGTDPVAIEMSRVTAAKLGVECAEFPGGHIAPMERPKEFAATLIDVLARRSA